jgi:hypothetical protein
VSGTRRRRGGGVVLAAAAAAEEEEAEGREIGVSLPPVGRAKTSGGRDVVTEGRESVKVRGDTTMAIPG